MDAASILCKVFEPIAEKEYLCLRRREYEELCKENQQIKEEIRKLQYENDELIQRLSDYNKNSVEECKKYKYFNEAKRKLASKNSFNIYRSIMGYAIVQESWSVEHQVKQVTWYYNEKCYIRFAVSCSGQKDLIEIVPSHHNFLNMRKFLMINQDAAGLLAAMLQYFKLMEANHYGKDSLTDG